MTRRTIRISAVLVVLAAAVIAAPSGAAATAKPHVTATVARCHRAPALADRFVIYHASMRRLHGTDHMGIRFELFQRRPGGKFTKVVAPGLGEFNLSDPGRKAYKFKKVIENLEAPASYRATVSFRWYAKSGKVLRTVNRRTRLCRMPDYRPNLRIAKITLIKRLANGNARYGVLVRNAGALAATDFDVGFSVANVARPAQTLPSLAVGARRALVFIGPACKRGDPLRAVVDPDDRVDESHETDNARVTACPG